MNKWGKDVTTTDCRFLSGLLKALLSDGTAIFLGHEFGHMIKAENARLEVFMIASGVVCCAKWIISTLCSS